MVYVDVKHHVYLVFQSVRFGRRDKRMWGSGGMQWGVKGGGGGGVCSAVSGSGDVIRCVYVFETLFISVSELRSCVKVEVAVLGSRP